jgi:PAS domain S-box-containing protein
MKQTDLQVDKPSSPQISTEALAEKVADRQPHIPPSSLEGQDQHLFEQLPLMSFVVDPHGTVLRVNRQGAEELGYRPEEILGRSVLAVFHPEDHPTVLGHLSRCFNAHEAHKSWELRKIRKDGTLMWVREFARATKDEKGIPQILIICKDITDRKRAEEDLRRSHEQLQDLTARLHSALEEERTKISREIHDQLGRILTTLKLDLGWVRERLSSAPPTVRDRLRAMAGLLETMGQSMHAICTTLRPIILDQLGLLPAIDRQAAEFQARTGVACKINLLLQRANVDPERATALFRMFQEILANVARHAEATAVTIAVSEKAGQLVLDVHDNGRGVSERELADPKSLGLRGLRERAMAFGGTVTISGNPGDGTTVSVTMPLGEARGKAVRAAQ